MGRLPPVCHILKAQQLRDNIRLSARSVSARPRPRAVLPLRVTRGTCGARLSAIQTLMPPWSRSRGRCRRTRSGTSGAHNRVAPPDRSVVLEHDQRGPLFLTRCGSHHELVAHHQFNPTGSKDLASTRAGA